MIPQQEQSTLIEKIKEILEESWDYPDFDDGAAAKKIAALLSSEIIKAEERGSVSASTEIAQTGKLGVLDFRECDWVKAEIARAERKARREEYDRCVHLLGRSHKDCPRFGTLGCIGYQNAYSDLMNNPPSENSNNQEKG
jgi:hypothetical protein